MDAILSLAVTQLVSAIIHRSKAEPVGDGRSHSWSGPHARDLTLLAALYDQSTAETFLHAGENFAGGLVTDPSLVVGRPS